MNTTNRKGQAILFVVVAVTIALSIGISVSSRAITAITRSARSDTATRVNAAAEGGIENFLVLSNETLDLISDPANDCDQYGAKNAAGECTVDFPADVALGDKIDARALVKVSPFSTNDTRNTHYWFNVKAGSVKEVNLEGYGSTKVMICWSDAAVGTVEDPESALYYIVYTDSKPIERGGLVASGKHGDELEGFVEIDSGSRMFSRCATEVELGSNDAYGIRIKALYSDAMVGVYPVGGASLPEQGYKIVSRGELVQGGAIKNTKTVTVYKSLPYLPAVFDYAIYTRGNL